MNEDYYRQVYQNQVELVFYGVFPGWTSGAEPQAANVDFYLRADSVHVIAVLEKLGVLDEGGALITQLEQAQLAANEKYGY
jgi:hypothetical protein